jgi:hypothetical protein
MFSNIPWRFCIVLGHIAFSTNSTGGFVMESAGQMHITCYLLINNEVVNNTEETMDQVMYFLTQFYELYPHLQNKSLYTTGKSYPGHYVTCLGY